MYDIWNLGTKVQISANSDMHNSGHTHLIDGRWGKPWYVTQLLLHGFKTVNEHGFNVCGVHGHKYNDNIHGHITEIHYRGMIISCD